MRSDQLHRFLINLCGRGELKGAIPKTDLLRVAWGTRLKEANVGRQLWWHGEVRKGEGILKRASGLVGKRLKALAGQGARARQLSGPLQSGGPNVIDRRRC